MNPSKKPILSLPSRKLNKEQAAVLGAVLSGKNVFFTGSAGTCVTVGGHFHNANYMSKRVIMQYVMLYWRCRAVTSLGILSLIHIFISISQPDVNLLP